MPEYPRTEIEGLANKYVLAKPGGRQESSGGRQQSTYSYLGTIGLDGG